MGRLWHSLQAALKAVERLGRRILVWLVAAVLGVRPRPVLLPNNPSVLVIRLDERVGNLLLLTPLLSSLRQRFGAGAHIDLLASARAVSVLGSHPALSRVLSFRKKALLSADGPLATPLLLRRARYDLAIEASNPTDPSATQTMIARTSGARHTVGPNHPGFGKLFSAPVSIVEGPLDHEIDLRLQLLLPVPGDDLVRQTSLGPLPEPAPESEVARALAELCGGAFGVINVGARLANKRLAPEVYADMARQLGGHGLRALVTWGPQERALAEQTVALCPGTILAPPTGLPELAKIFGTSRLVISCDTGPMHLSVAVGIPTLAIFVSTEPRRYGYTQPPHGVIDARSRPASEWMSEVQSWLSQRAKQLPQVPPGRQGPQWPHTQQLQQPIAPPLTRSTARGDAT